MDKPPPPKRDPDDLAEVERALSVLKGRHPEHERISREDAAKQAARKAQLADASRVEATAARNRRLKLGIGLVAGAIVLAVVAVFFRSEVTRRGHIEQASDPFRAMGFVVLETTSRGAPGQLDANVEPGCLLAVSTSSAALSITIGATNFGGPPPVLFCVCQNVPVTVMSAAKDAHGGLALLRADAARIGGSRAFYFAPFSPMTTSATDDSCADASFDAWLEAGHWPKPSTDEASVPAALRAVSFGSVAVMKHGAPFAVVELAADSCLLATAGRADEELALRMKGSPGRVLEAKGSFAWCASAPSLAIVERVSLAVVGREVEIAVFAGPAKSVGGMLGVREVAREAKIDLGNMGTPPADRGWDARAAMIASSVPEALVNAAAAPSIPRDNDARIFAVSFGTPSALTPDTPPDTYSFCEPPLDPKVTESLCAFSGPVTWRIAGSEAVGGVGRAKLPFWLFALSGIDDPAALKVTTQLLSLARKLKRAGFEPTTLEAMTELPQGVEILGRTGEHAVVAIMLAGTAPYAFPLSAAVPWTLDKAPAIAALEPLQKITLVTSEKKLPPIASRRTVVFRQKGKP